MNILTVDDDELVLELMAEFISAIGLNPIVASSGAKAMAILEMNQDVDLIITDVQMPGMNGIELARSARLLRSTLPILYVSGYSKEFDVFGCSLESGQTFLSKPFSLANLDVAIRRAGGSTFCV